MSDPVLPRLVDGASIRVTQRVRYDLDCPKCRKSIDVTDIGFGAVIQCPGCKNLTWRPEFQPRWYFKFRNFALAALGSFILGFLASLLASYAWEHHIKARPVQGSDNKVTTQTKP